MFNLRIFGKSTAAIAAERQQNVAIAPRLANVIAERLYADNIEDPTGQRPMWYVRAEGDKISISTVIDAHIFSKAKNHVYAVTGAWPSTRTETLQLEHPAANARIHLPSDKLVKAIEAGYRKGYEAKFTVTASLKMLKHLQPAIEALPNDNPDKSSLLQHLKQTLNDNRGLLP